MTSIYRFDSEDDMTGTVNALRVAAERFDQNARLLRSEVRPVPEGVAVQFEHQAKQARRIADEIEMVCG